MSQMGTGPGRFRATHLVRSGSFPLAGDAARALLLFTPEGERAWVPGWEPEVLHPESGPAGAGAVFRTTHGGEETLWLWLRHDPEQGVAEYARVTPGSRMGTVQVRVEPDGAASSRVTVRYELTALSPAGNDALAAFGAGFAGMLEEWQRTIGAVLQERTRR